MKWYMGALQGGAQSIRENLASMRDLAGQKELEQLKIDETAKEKNKLLNIKYGSLGDGRDLIFNNRDIKAMGLGEDREINYTLEDFKNNFQNYSSQDINYLKDTDESGWNKLKSRAHEIYFDNWKAIKDMAGNVTYRPSDYSYLDNYGAAGEELKLLLDDLNPLDKPEKKTTVDGFEFFDLKGENEQDTVNILNPDTMMIMPDKESLDKMKADLKPLMMHDMYAGFTQDSEFATFTSNVGNVIVAHSMMQTLKEGNTNTMNEQSYDNIAEAMLAYDMSFQDVTKIMDYMLPKYEVNIISGTTGKLSNYDSISTDEKGKSENAVQAYPAMFELVNKIINVYEKTGTSGAIDKAFNFIQGFMGGPNSQIAQFGGMIQMFTDKNKFADVSVEGTGTGTDRITGFKKWSENFDSLYKELGDYHMGKLTEEQALRVAKKVMRYSLAFQLALVEQGSGGKAVSDQDFDRAFDRTGVDWFENPEQGITKLKELESEFYPKFIKSHMSNEYGKTAKRGWGVWDNITAAKHRLSKKLQINLNQHELFMGSADNKEWAVQVFHDPSGTPVPAYGRLYYLRDFLIGKQFKDLDDLKDGLQGFWSEMTPTERMWATPDGIFYDEFIKSMTEKKGNSVFTDSGSSSTTLGIKDNSGTSTSTKITMDLDHITASLKGFEKGNYSGGAIIVDNPRDVKSSDIIPWGEKDDNKYRQNPKWSTDDKAVRVTLEKEKTRMINLIINAFNVKNIQEAVALYNQYYIGNNVMALNQEGVNLLLYQLPDLEEALKFGGYPEMEPVSQDVGLNITGRMNRIE